MSKKALPAEIPASKIKIDEDLYPRHRVDPLHVSALVDALRGGRALPPVVLRSKDNTLLEGRHRREAYIVFDGEDALVPVTYEDVTTKRDSFYSAVYHNSCHGLRLSGYDMKHCVIKGKAMGMSTKTMIAALSISKRRFDNIAEQIAKVRGEKGNGKVPLKRPVEHLKGETISKHEAEVIEKIGANGLKMYVKNILYYVRNPRLIDENDDKAMTLLMELKEALESFFSQQNDEA